MNVKPYLYYFESYVFNFPAYMFHELCHWIFYFFTCLLGFNSMPVIKFDRWYSYTQTDNSNSQTKSMCAYVNLDCDVEWVIRTGAAMPAVGILLLFILSPWYMDLVYLTQINTMWLSMSDIEHILGKSESILRIRNQKQDTNKLYDSKTRKDKED